MGKDSRLRAAVFGLGDIARKAHLPLLATNPEIQVTGLISRTGTRVEATIQQFRLAPSQYTLAEVLTDPPDVAFVLSSTESHPEVAIPLLKAGVDVYLEKPIAADLASTRAVVAAAEASGRLLMVGFNRRFAPHYRRAQERFARQSPRVVLLQKHRFLPTYAWPPVTAMMDDVIHMVDLARYFAGELEEVWARIQVDDGRFRAIAAGMAGLDGRQVLLSQSYVAGSALERVELHGDGQSIRMEEMDRLTIDATGRRWQEDFDPWVPTLEKRGFTGALAHFLSCVRQRQQPVNSGREALRSHELAWRLLQAAGCLDADSQTEIKRLEG